MKNWYKKKHKYVVSPLSSFYTMRYKYSQSEYKKAIGY